MSLTSLQNTTYVQRAQAEPWGLCTPLFD